MRLSPVVTLIFLIVIVLVGAKCETSQPGKSTLVIVDSPELRNSHSKFFNILEKRGFQLTFKQSSDSNIKLKQYGEFNYDNLLLLAPEAEKIKGINDATLREFVDAGKNIIMAAESQLPEELRTFAANVGVEYDDDENNVIDHFYYDTELDEGSHNVIVTDNMIKNRVVLGTSSIAPILFSGPGMKLSSNRFLLPILRGNPTSYSGNDDDAEVHVAGQSTTLVAGLQARNGARVTFLGSLDMISDRAFDAKVNPRNAVKSSKISSGKAGNGDLARQLLTWGLQERGVLRHRNVFHHLKGTNHSEYTYRIKEDIVYNVIIEEWNGREWQGFDADDVQLEFIMLDPWLRIPLRNKGNGRYVSEFRIPDVYGVYKFNVHYQRQGYSPLVFSDQVAIRPYRMNEFERFLEMAYPYYSSTLSLVVGFFVFGFLFLYTPTNL